MGTLERLASGVGEDAASKAAQAENYLKEGAAWEARAGEQLRASEAAREALDDELWRLHMQTEQWRKAMEAAAAAGAEDHGGKIFLSSATAAVLSRGNHLTVNGNGWGSPATMPDDGDDKGFGGKQKGAGIRVLGDLWKKKGSK